MRSTASRDGLSRTASSSAAWHRTATTSTPSPTRSRHARQPRSAAPDGRRLGERRTATTTIPSGPDPTPSDADIAAGTENNVYIEHYELQPIDPQTNGPQLFYGLRYHVHIVKPGEVETFHDQVGYWLWEPAARTVTHTIAIPRGQVALASRHRPSPTRRVRGDGRSSASETFGILSNPFLDRGVPHAELPSSASRSTRRHLVVRRRHRDAAPRPRRAVPPHRPQHARAGRGADAQPARGRDAPTR